MDCGGAKIKLLALMAGNTSFLSTASLGVESWTLFPHIITQDTIDIKTLEVKRPPLNLATYRTRNLLYGWSHLVDTVSDHIAKYQQLREAERNGELGEIGHFWIKYMDCIWLFV